MKSRNSYAFYKAIKEEKKSYHSQSMANLIAYTDENRVKRLSKEIELYLSANLTRSVDRRASLQDYRANPYVLLTSATIMELNDPSKFADFLFNNKLYMGLETSFGKSIESALLGQYPIVGSSDAIWEEPIEKRREFDNLIGLSNEEKARERNNSIWREIDKSVVDGNKRFLVTIKSGPNTINDTQVEGMKYAIAQNYSQWMEQTRYSYPNVEELDIVIGLTYGTEKTTNNKENQILIKLLDLGFEEEDRDKKPGVLIHESGDVRVYRLIGQDFWAFVGNPSNPSTTQYVFLEILLALSMALSDYFEVTDFEEVLNRKILQLSQALASLTFPRNSLPTWVREDFSVDQLFWLATAMTSFFDEGI